MLENNQNKQCTKCGETKSLDEFHADKTRKDGKFPQCNACVRAYRQKNRERILEQSRQWRKDNAEHNKQYKQNNAVKISERNRQYAQENAEYFKRYRQTPKGKAVSKNANHKRRAITSEGDVTTDQLLELQQNATHCYWCSVKLTSKVKIHIDHYTPLSNGGEHTLSNLVVACSKCNLSKHSKDPQEFAMSLGRLL